jgi:arylsulfatase A-like enzyme
VERKTPNILFIMSDDHASHAMSCYGSKINKTPNLDRIADGGMIFNNSFCTNSISTPSRAAILTGTYNHINKVTTLDTKMDNCLQTFPKLLHGKGYQTAIFGKWHLGTGPEHCPTGFDNWAVLPGQGLYHNPDFIFKGPGGGEKRVVKGYATDIITDMSLDWLKKRDIKRPFCLLCHHKAPHRHWEPDEKHARLYLDKDIPEPETLYDDYSNRSSAASEATLRIGRDMNEKDLKCEINRNLSEKELRKWAYQRYIKDYLRVIASVDDNVGRILDYLDEEGLTENTIVVYTSDQGFFLGDHGWFDKRFMYEESIKMPFIIRYPKEIKPGSVNDNMILNVDYAETFLDYAEIDIPSNMQGRSFRPLLNGELPEDWQTSMYYRYWMHCGGHNVYAHYGVRTLQHKLIYYYSQALGQEGTVDDPKVPEWELFDLKKDPHEMENIYNKPEYKEVTENLKEELHHLQQKVKDIGVAE